MQQHSTQMSVLSGVPAHPEHHLMIANAMGAQHSLEFCGSASLFGSGRAGTSPLTGPIKLGTYWHFLEALRTQLGHWQFSPSNVKN